MTRRWELAGRIAGTGFASGDRVVVGHWDRSPVGPFVDLMWAEPDGRRVLVVPDERAAAFVTAVYGFDAVEVVATMAAAWDGRRLTVDAGRRRVELVAGRGVPIPGPRPAWLTRHVEGPVARALLGVRTYGVSPTGVREWYRASRWSPLRAAEAAVDGRSCGPMGPVSPACGFGFSEPPRRPSLTAVRPLLEDPSGRLDMLLAVPA